MANIRGRFHAVDALRGLIMVIMAIDHASGFIARQHASEFWAGAMTTYDSAFPFLTRWITHLCAPGFFFLMGAGLYWFAASRLASGWTDAKIVSRTASRGLALFLLAQVLETPLIFVQEKMNPAAHPLSKTLQPPPLDGTAPYWAFITLSGLGLVMICSALLLRLPKWTWLLTTALSVFATNTLLPASGKPGPAWETILFAPGISQHIVAMYPVIPWLGVTAAGMYFGYWWRSRPEIAAARVWMVGAGLLTLGIALRFAGGWGNIRPPRDNGWIEFLNNVKYPPSLVFWSMSVGIDLLLVWVLIQLPHWVKRENSPLIVFGQTPLFFYLLHFWVFVALGLTVFARTPPLETAYVVWFVVVIALYPVCRWYRTFKASKPAESLWRMF